MAGSSGDRAAAAPDVHPGLTIDELARAVGITPRNVRAYQTRGLVHSPTVHGRTGYYDGTHVSRLLLVKELQERGLNLAAARALLDSREVVTWLFHDMRERARASGTGAAVRLPAVSVARLRELDPQAPDLLAGAGVLTRARDGEFTADAALFTAALRLIEQGVPLAEVVRVLVDVSAQARMLADHVGQVLAATPAPQSPLADTTSDGAADRADTLTPYAVQMCVAGFESLLSTSVTEAVRRARDERADTQEPDGEATQESGR
ncbi:MAG: MerR family transcriptional regulator [Actinomycetes bacterium]